MRVKELHDLRDATPFRSFHIHLADGRAIPVRNRDFLMSSPSGRTMIIYQPDDSFEIVDLMLVTSLRVKPANGRGSHAK